MKLEHLIPVDGFPLTGGQANCDELWQGNDSEEQFRKNGHPHYTDRDIVYRYNSRGFRGPEFEETAEIKMISIGCRWVFGVGLPVQDTFHELFAARLRQETGKSVVNWNVGYSGAGGDYLARILHLTVNKLDPDIVLVLFPNLSRREYVSANGIRVNYVPNFIPGDRVSKHIYDKFHALTSEMDDQVNFFRNYSSIASLLAQRDWFFSFTNLREIGLMTDHLDRGRYAGEYKFVDRARDNGHPGRETHRNLRDIFWSKFVDSGGLTRLAAK